jgi:exopolysaccharide biosynthesis polyprenyl glycosylphosphotransferase
LLAAFSKAGVNGLGHFRHNLRVDAWFPLGTMIVLAVSGSYRASRVALKPDTASGMKDLCLALGAGGVLALLFADITHVVTHMALPDSTQTIVAVFVAVVLVAAMRVFVGGFVTSHRTTRVLVVGSGDLVERIELYLRIHKGMQLVGRVDDADIPSEGSLGTMRDLRHLVDDLDIGRVIVAFPERASSASVSVLRDLQDRVHIAVVPRYFELVSWRSALTDLSGLPLMEVAPAHMSRWDRAAKRAMDILVSCFLLLLFLPVMLVISVAVKLSSPGPVLFRQERLGRNREHFTINKFRTMRVEAPGESQTREPVSADDSHKSLAQLRAKSTELLRATRVGVMLRRTGLDELPQLLNVLMGQMSIVGPRPFIEEESEHLTGWMARRFEVRPGITGLWQVSGRNELSTEDLRQLDFVYVASWSLWWDLKIVWDTPRAILRGLGAY